MSMERLEAFVELLYEEKICDEFDRIVPIVADEGMGKSTFILQFMVLWKRQTGQEIVIEDMLDQLVYTRDGFKNALATYPARSVIAVPDAARALHRKEAMDSEQIEVEKDLLDVRVKEHVILLGYQDWDIIPTFLQKRRAKNLFRIPTRGQLWGYGRDSIDDRLDDDSWPAADMTAQFPSLEGTDLWRRYKELDERKKKERMQAAGAEERDVRDIVEQVKSDGLERVTSVHGGWNKRILDADLIELEYDLTVREAKKVKKLLERDDEVDLGDDTETNTG